ncbi:hypothetical protein [Parapedobacter sp.]
MADYKPYFSDEAKDSPKPPNNSRKTPDAYWLLLPNLHLPSKLYREDARVRRAIVHRTISFLYRVVGKEVQIIVFFDNRQEPIL